MPKPARFFAGSLTSAAVWVCFQKSMTRREGARSVIFRRHFLMSGSSILPEICQHEKGPHITGANNSGRRSQESGVRSQESGVKSQELQNETALFRSVDVINPPPCEVDFDSASSRLEAGRCSRHGYFHPELLP